MSEKFLQNFWRTYVRGETEDNQARRRSQQLAVAGVVLVVVVIIGAALLLSPAPKAPAGRDTHDTMLSLGADRVQRDRFVLQSELAIDQLTERIARLERRSAQNSATSDEAIKQIARTLAEQGVSIQELVKSSRDLEAYRTTAEAREKAREEAFEANRAAGRSALTTDGTYDPNELDRRIAAAGGIGSTAAASGFSAPAPQGTLALVTLEPPKDTRTPAKKPAAPHAFYQSDTPIALNRAAGTRIDAYLPAGSFAKATLLTGVTALASGAGLGTPMPVLMFLDVTTLPGLRKAGTKSCHLTGAATADLSSERVHVRLDRLSCVGPADEVLDIPVSGYAVGPDGRVGVRGQLVSRSGAAISAALSTAVISGLGKSIALSSQQTTTSTLTGVTTATYSDAARAGFGQGFANAADRLVQYYINLSERIYPCIEVSNGLPLEIVFSQGVHLKNV